MATGIPGIGGGGTEPAAGSTAVVEPVEETIVEETPASETPAEGDESAPPAEGDDAEKPPEEDGAAEYETDGRKIDTKTREAIAALKKVNPNAAKQVADAYFRNQALVKEFPDAKDFGEALNKVREVNALVETYGGEEGIKGMQEKNLDYDKEIEQFANGDPQLAATLYEANPQGLIRSTTASLELLAAKNLSHLDEAILPFIQSRLDSAQFDQRIFSALELVKEGKGQEAYDTLLNIAKWSANLKAIAKNLTENRTKVDPREEQYKTKAAQLETDKQEFTRKTTEADVNRRNAPELAKTVAPLLKQIKLSPEGRRNFEQGLISRVWESLAADKAYMARVRTLREKGDPIATADYIHGQFKALLPRIYEIHRNHVYPNLKAVKPGVAAAAKPNGTPAKPAEPAKAATPGGAPAGRIRVTVRPSHETVDWTVTADADWLGGRATLVGGKRVIFDPALPANRPAR